MSDTLDRHPRASASASPRKPGAWVLHARIAGAWSLVAVACLSLGGCVMAGFVAGSIIREPVRGIYKPIDQPTLVFVDDPSRVLDDPTLCQVTASAMEQEFRDNKVFKVLIGQDKLQELRGRTDVDFDRMSIVQIGRRLGASQVLHVNLVEMSVEEEVALMRPRMVVTIKMIDTSQGKRLFPTVDESHGQRPSDDKPAGYAFEASREIRHSEPPDMGKRRIIARQTAELLGTQVAQLFFDHRRPDAVDTINEPPRSY